MDASPRFWLRLAHVCRIWRRIVFASPRELRLQLFFTHGTPVPKIIDYWPALPIVAEYGGSLALDPPAPEDEDDIMAALKQSDRVTSIRLTVTSSVLEWLCAIEGPFSELEHLVLLTRDSVRLTLPSTFRWGSRLRCLHLTRITIPTLIELLHTSKNLVDLRLHDVLIPWHFSSEALTNTLCGMAQLQSLSLHFLPVPRYHSLPLLHRERVVLPVLARLDFRGFTGYLDFLVARIEAPRLRDIEVTFDEYISDLSTLSNFIDRTGMHKSHRRALILSFERAISISLIQPGSATCLRLRLLREPISEQLFFMDQVRIHFSALLFNVEGLRISATRPSRRNDSYFNGWSMMPFNSFTGVKRLHVVGNLSTAIVHALRLDSRRETLLPTLQELYIPQPGPRHALLREAVVSCMISRRISGYPIEVEYEQLYTSEREPRGTGTIYAQCHHRYSLIILN
jgi:hypothetical protein